MSVTDAIGFAAAEQIERSVGPFVALPSYKRLLAGAASAADRARAARGALRCIARLADGAEARALARTWASLPSDALLLPITIEACKALARVGRADGAAALAEAEVRRAPCARALYLWARCLEHAGAAADARAAFARAAEAAIAEDLPAASKGGGDAAPPSRTAWRSAADGAREVHAASVAAAARLGGAVDDASAASVAAAERADTAGLPAPDVLAVARLRLRSASRFARASGLSLLEEVARGPDEGLARAAVRVAAEHADDLGAALSSVEADRLAATLKRWSAPAEREAALGRLASVVRVAAARGEGRDAAVLEAARKAPELLPLANRAQAYSSGGGQGSYGVSSDDRTLALADLGLEILVASRRGRDAEAGALLGRAREALEASSVAPAPLWTAVRVALDSGGPATAREAARLVSAVLDQASARARPVAAPPCGWLALGRALEARGHAAPAPGWIEGASTPAWIAAFRAAVQAREDGAGARLGEALLRDGWRLARAEAPDRDEGRQRRAAVDCLREARELLGVARAVQSTGS